MAGSSARPLAALPAGQHFCTMAVMAGSDGEARELEDLGGASPEPRDGDALAQHDGAAPAPHKRRGENPAVTSSMKVALFGGAAIFTVGALVKLVVMSWVLLAIAITAVSATILAHTGGLESSTFATCVKAAIVVDVALLLGIVGAWVVRLGRRELGQDPGGLYVRHPVQVTAAWQLVALIAVLLAGWRRSVFFPHPLATIVVLANAYFFALIGTLFLGNLINLAWGPIRMWGQRGPYRTGLLTGVFLSLGCGGLLLSDTGWYQDHVHQASATLGLSRQWEGTGFVGAQLRGLCLAAEETAPQLAGGDASPACALLMAGAEAGASTGANGDGGTSGADGCFTELSSEMKRARESVRARFRLSPFDADDVVMQALMATCTRVPLPRNLGGYFWKVVNTRGLGIARSARCTVPLDPPEEAIPRVCASGPAEVREELLAQLWDRALCELNDREADALRGRLADDLSFRALGERMRLGTTEAKDLFHNAIKKLRVRLRPCLPDLDLE